MKSYRVGMAFVISSNKANELNGTPSQLWPWRESKESGGRDRGRTGDLIVANDALSQLSYSPTSSREILTRLVEVGNLRFGIGKPEN
jgi:hypothetical protein